MHRDDLTNQKTTGLEVLEVGRVPVKAWTRGVPVEDQARKQLRNVASLPFVFKHVVVMPDVHWGMGATVGSVIATKGAIVPAAVGVDIGCGMVASQSLARIFSASAAIVSLSPGFTPQSASIGRRVCAG